MKKLIVMDPVRICGSDLTSGTLDEKRECMGYDITPCSICESEEDEGTMVASCCQGTVESIA
jgi:hypothetical protein